MAPHSKIAAAFIFMLVVVATPIQNLFAVFTFALLILGMIILSQIPFRIVFGRSLIEIPFILFAFLMPFFGSGEMVSFLGVDLHKSGLIAGATIITKGTIGVLIAILLSGTTTARDLLLGLERLKTPIQIVNIATFMLRYVNVLNDELSRMKVARESRGFQATGVKSWPIIARTLGALFIRAFERGERVYLAMLARGYDGKIYSMNTAHQSPTLRAFLLPFVAGLAALIGWRFL